MEQPAWRVVVLSTIPDVAAMLAATVRRLGHEPVAALGVEGAPPVAGVSRLSLTSEVGAEIVLAPHRSSVAPILRSFSPDLVLTWAFPWRIPVDALEVPTLGALNYHPSALPRHRGPNPLAWTIRAGDADYGMTWHRMTAEFDAGPILAQRTTPVLEEDAVDDAVARLTVLAVRMLKGVFARVAAGEAGEPQRAELATAAPPFGEDYATIDWSQPARAVHDQVRAWSFTPGTRSVFGPLGELEGQTVRVLRTTLRENDAGQRVECGDGPLWVLACEQVE
jgi:methionyl-tRNA formyltransferase